MDIDKIRAPIKSLLTWCVERSQPGERWPALACEAALAELDTAPPAPIFLAVYIGTTNDTNGNPRRGWYVSRLDGAPVVGDAATAWIEEGYSGHDALYRAVAGAPQKGETYGDSHGSTDYLRDKTNRHYTDRARSLVHETGRIDVTPGEYRDARKLPRFGGAA